MGKKRQRKSLLLLGAILVLLSPTPHIPQGEVTLSVVGRVLEESHPSSIKWDCMVQAKTYATNSQSKL